MYIEQNPKTKKAAKQLVAEGKAKVITVSPFETVPEDGEVFIEGPHYPKPHMWYGKGEVKNGRLVKLV